MQIKVPLYPLLSFQDKQLVALIVQSSANKVLQGEKIKMRAGQTLNNHKTVSMAFLFVSCFFDVIVSSSLHTDLMSAALFCFFRWRIAFWSDASPVRLTTPHFTCSVNSPLFSRHVEWKYTRVISLSPLFAGLVSDYPPSLKNSDWFLLSTHIKQFSW